MKKSTLILAGSILVAVAAAAAGGIYTMKQLDLRSASAEKLKEAREALESARSTGNWNQSRNLVVQARSLAAEAANLWKSNATDAAVVEGEALLRMTKYRDAIQVLERAMMQQKDDAQIEALAAESYHQAFLTGRKESDFGRASNLYDSALEHGGGVDVLLNAGKLHESLSHHEDADHYFNKIESSAPDSREAQEVRNLKIQRGGEMGR